MLDHLSIQVADPEASKAFYETVLATLGGTAMMSFGPVTGFGQQAPTFWIGPVGDAGAPHLDIHYYGGFVRDPDGNNVEAVRHDAHG